jgi:hypothetical protein
MSFETFTRRVTPFVSLGLGIATVVFWRRGLWFAPWAILILVAGWALASIFGRGLVPQPAGVPDDPVRVVEPRKRWLVRTALRSLVAGLYQNVLFFLVPLWAVSATLGSWNVLVPALLGAMALFSCFEIPYTRWIIERRGPRTVWSAVLLFAALVQVGPVLTEAPLRWYAAVAAYLAAGAGILVGVPGLGRRPWSLVGLALISAAGAGALIAWLAPWLPPVPIQCKAAALATAVEEREPVGRETRFVAGVERVYAWFSVAAPERFRQQVRFVFLHEGERVGRPFETSVVGGRREGFRTWSYVHRPWPGRWRVELRTDGDQLIARRDFEVLRALAVGEEAGQAGGSP